MRRHVSRGTDGRMDGWHPCGCYHLGLKCYPLWVVTPPPQQMLSCQGLTLLWPYTSLQQIYTTPTLTKVSPPLTIYPPPQQIWPPPNPPQTCCFCHIYAFVWFSVRIYMARAKKDVDFFVKCDLSKYIIQRKRALWSTLYYIIGGLLIILCALFQTLLFVDRKRVFPFVMAGCDTHTKKAKKRETLWVVFDFSTYIYVILGGPNMNNSTPVFPLKFYFAWISFELRGHFVQLCGHFIRITPGLEQCRSPKFALGR